MVSVPQNVKARCEAVRHEAILRLQPTMLLLYHCLAAGKLDRHIQTSLGTVLPIVESEKSLGKPLLVEPEASLLSSGLRWLWPIVLGVSSRFCEFLSFDGSSYG